ncbi:DUF2637 domain-containing protein [Streptomyces sp. B-S-A8]|uniref:DUF2637 domain-containing protein n=1 Tax=Streptomyces solicavernae TaxID=3043614 RepID=A0ABT6RTE6_9ACTN|nr:DUF2637 domain-containing protein [Streptomyces sp. B-S-A8]MDI3387053.1 DUF2637 domain-containing protein [Streptomyces sp. B-S-A8]
MDPVLIQAVIAGALSFSHLHDLAHAAGQKGWQAWAYPISVDLLLVAAWRRLRTARSDRAAWLWFVIALAASLGANIATAGLLDLEHVPAWLRIVVAGWPALAFLGGTLLVHTPAAPEPVPAPVAASVEEPPAVDLQRTDTAPELDTAPEPPASEPVAELPAAEPEPEPEPAPVSVPDAVKVPPALLDHARKIAATHEAANGSPITPDTLRARLGLPAPMGNAIAAQLQLN